MENKASKSLYLECASGISGDMAVAAMIDLNMGVDTAALSETLRSIPVQGFSTKISRVQKSGIECCDFAVALDKEHENHDHDMHYLHGDFHVHEEEHDSDGGHNSRGGHEEGHHEHRNLMDIYKIIDETKMTEEARSLAKKMFEIIAKAEGHAHGKKADEVHFHEVGAVDSIVDIIALSCCFTDLGVSKVYVPCVNEGKGFVRCAHGLLPVPVPAVTAISQEYGINLSFMQEEGEFVTPTGAAFVAAVKTNDSLPQKFKILGTGMGAGKRSYKRPSILRAMIVEEVTEQNRQSLQSLQSLQDTDFIVKLETNIDDCTGEALGFVMEELFIHGAKDVSFVPCFMKKNRPAYLLNVICEESDVPALEKIIFENTTTIGIRRVKMERTVLEREGCKVSTKFGEVSAKKVRLYGKERVYPEHDSIARICREKDIPYEQVRSEFRDSLTSRTEP